jgi:hypothetical protein
MVYYNQDKGKETKIMIYIEKNPNDSLYPYIIFGCWEQKMYLTEKDLEKLKKEIEKIIVDKIK